MEVEEYKEPSPAQLKSYFLKEMPPSQPDFVVNGLEVLPMSMKELCANFYNDGANFAYTEFWKTREGSSNYHLSSWSSENLQKEFSEGFAGKPTIRYRYAKCILPI